MGEKGENSKKKEKIRYLLNPSAKKLDLVCGKRERWRKH
jgi:hypothetical protein